MIGGVPGPMHWVEHPRKQVVVSMHCPVSFIPTVGTAAYAALLALFALAGILLLRRR